MLRRSLLSAALPFLFLPCCQQQQLLDVCVLEEVRFQGCDRPAHEKTLISLMIAMDGREHSMERDADELAERSLLILGNSPASFLSEEELEEAEEAYLLMENQEKRIRLAADVMDALLNSPTHSVSGRQLHSYHRLDVNAWQKKAGEFFAPCGDQCIDADKTMLFKRMVARIILEDVACNPELEKDQRCAAVICLQHICREALLSAEGAWTYSYMIDALPLNRRDAELKRALLES